MEVTQTHSLLVLAGDSLREMMNAYVNTILSDMRYTTSCLLSVIVKTSSGDEYSFFSDNFNVNGLIGMMEITSRLMIVGDEEVNKAFFEKKCGEAIIEANKLKKWNKR